MPPCEHSAGREAGHGPAATPAQGRGAPPAAPHPLRGPRPPGSCALAGGRLPGTSKDPPHRPLWARGARSNHVKTRPGSGSEEDAVQVGARGRGRRGPGSGARGRGQKARGPRALGRRPPQARPARREAAATHRSGPSRAEDGRPALTCHAATEPATARCQPGRALPPVGSQPRGAGDGRRRTALRPGSPTPHTSGAGSRCCPSAPRRKSTIRRRRRKSRLRPKLVPPEIQPREGSPARRQCRQGALRGSRRWWRRGVVFRPRDRRGLDPRGRRPSGDAAKGREVGRGR